MWMGDDVIVLTVKHWHSHYVYTPDEARESS